MQAEKPAREPWTPNSTCSGQASGLQCKHKAGQQSLRDLWGTAWYTLRKLFLEVPDSSIYFFQVKLLLSAHCPAPPPAPTFNTAQWGAGEGEDWSMLEMNKENSNYHYIVPWTANVQRRDFDMMGLERRLSKIKRLLHKPE